MPAFHEVTFPLDVALGARGGPERRTEIVTTGSGREERNARWAHARRRWNAGYGVKSLDALSDVVAFFEERRGRLYGFRWRDRLDHSSGLLGALPAPGDQLLGEGDGENASFQLKKTYGGVYAPYARPIAKAVAGSIRVAVDGGEKEEGADFDSDSATGLIVFRAGHTPPEGAAITAGFLFDVPVRFDTDFLEVDLAAFAAGEIPSIPVVEIRL
jgi:uncharacterized protein (TIGR02217 family)